MCIRDSATAAGRSPGVSALLRAPMLDLSYRSPMPVPAEVLYDWHARPGALDRLTPPWTDLTVVSFDGLHEGARARLKVGIGPVRRTWVAEHRNVEPGTGFDDVQVKGPFRTWEQRHRMEPGDAPGTSAMHDRLRVEMPVGSLGESIAQGQIDRMFAYRHRTLAADLALHARLDVPPMRVAMTGAGGLVGRALTTLLTTGGHTVVPLSRTRGSEGAVFWDVRTGEIDADALGAVDAVVHLAGEPVNALRWTEEKKTRILASREQGTLGLARTLARLPQRPRVFVSASAVGIYGDRPGEVLTEASATSERGFLPLVCRLWEQATAPAADAGIRTVQMRTGVVLSPAGGALATMLPAFRAGLGGRIGGEQMLPWITLDDAIGGYLHALGHDALAGPVNLTAPAPVSMATFAQTLARVLHRPALLPVPGALVSLATGEMGRELLLASADVRPQRLTADGYAFRHADLDLGLRHLLGRARDAAAFPSV